MGINLTDFEEFRKNLWSVNEQFEYRIKRMLEIIQIDKVEIVYPQKLFIDRSQELKLFLFTESNIYMVVFYPDIKISTLKKNDIKRLELNLSGNSSEPDYELIIKLNQDEEIRLFNVDDTNEDWRYHFAQYILKIYKYLTCE